MATASIVRFELARAGRVTVSVFDLAGRRVRTLSDGLREIGGHELVWNGEDDAGRKLKPGVYLLRLVAPDWADVQRLVKVQ